MISYLEWGVHYLTDYEAHYCPVITEAVGLCNLASGVSQVFVGCVMKAHSSPRYHTTVSSRHIARGKADIQLGLRRFLPGAVMSVCGLYIFNRAWTLIPQRASA